MTVTADPQLLRGWGRTAPTRARVAAPGSVAEVAELLAGAGPRGVTARGLGRSYGDAAQNAGGLVLDTSGLDEIVDIDLERGTVTAQAGVSLDRLMRTLLPLGWFVPVTPGTRYVTLGGAIAFDVHGKNHHRDGGFAAHVNWLDLIGADGGVRRVTAGEDAFAATAGGMGLTGVIAQAEVRLQRVRTSLMRVTTERAVNLDDLLTRMDEGDDRFQYSVAWIDCLAKGTQLGRGVLTRGDHAEPGELPAKRAAHPLAFAPRTLAGVPDLVPGGLLNPVSMRLFNTAWFHRAASHAVTLESIAAFFHPLDAVRDWNRLYGPRGLVQYQALLPFGREAELRALLERLSDSGAASFLAVLKRFGPGAPLLSFPRPGWTLAVDVPAAVPGLGGVLDALDEIVAGAGGRVYLAKDARMRPETMHAMYPELPAWREIRAQLDPDEVMVSDLSRRLGVVG